MTVDSQGYNFNQGSDSKFKINGIPALERNRGFNVATLSEENPQLTERLCHADTYVSSSPANDFFDCIDNLVEVNEIVLVLVADWATFYQKIYDGLALLGSTKRMSR